MFIGIRIENKIFKIEYYFEKWEIWNLFLKNVIIVSVIYENFW